MKKILSLLTIVAMLFTACDKENETPGTAEQIKLTTNAEISVSSGSAFAFLKYEILEIVEGAEVEAKANVDWINNFGYKEMGKISFTIDTNPDSVNRTGEITVTYDKSSFKVIIKQKGNPAPTLKTITDFGLTVKYYGIQAGMYNYYLAFSDLGLDENNMEHTPNAHYYFVDLYLDEAPADNENVTIPLGTYEFDKSSSGFADTFTDTYSWYHTNDAYGNSTSQISYDAGKLVVEEGKITLEVTLTFGDIQETHTVIYEGDYEVINESNLYQ